jgi:hypothetical protein
MSPIRRTKRKNYDPIKQVNNGTTSKYGATDKIIKIHQNDNTNTNANNTITVTWVVSRLFVPIMFAALIGYIRKRQQEINADTGRGGLQLIKEINLELITSVIDHQLIAKRVIEQWWTSLTDSGRLCIVNAYYSLWNLSLFLYLLMKPLVYMSYLFYVIVLVTQFTNAESDRTAYM